MKRRRPAPEPIMLARLRTLWLDHPDLTSRTLLIEIARLHDVLRSVDQLNATVAAVWLAECGGKLSALHQLNLLLEKEPAVMEQKVRRSARKIAPATVIDPEDDAMPYIELDGPG